MECPGFIDNIGKAFVTGRVRSNAKVPCECGDISSDNSYDSYSEDGFDESDDESDNDDY